MPAWLRAVLVASVPYVAWMTTFPAANSLNRSLELGFILLLQGLVVRGTWKASRRIDLPSETRAALRWFMAGWSMNMLATLALPFAAMSRNGAFPVGLPDLGYLAAYTFFFTGLLRLPRAEAPLPGFLRILMDGAVFVVGVGAPLWLFAIRPTLAHGLNLDSFLVSAYPAMAFLGVMTLNLALLRSRPAPDRSAHYLLLAGIGISWLADLVFSLQVDNVEAFVGLKFWGNIINTLALLCFLVGTWRTATDPQPEGVSRPLSHSPVPMLAILFVSLWLVGLVSKGMHPNQVYRVLLGILLLILVLLVRESLALRESVRHGAETARQVMEARFEALVRHSSDPILVTDQDGRILFSDPASVRITGLDSDSLEGFALRNLLHPEDRDAGEAFLQTLAGTPTATCVQRVRMGPPEGPWRLLEFSGCNLLADPAVGGLVLNARDITERHRLEDQLREAQKMEAVGRLAGGVAHDFNNLLSAIMGNLELAVASLPAGHPVHKELTRIQGAATRGAALTGRLLAFCRRDLPESRVVDPIALVHGVAPLITGLLGERIHLAFDFSGEVGTFSADPNELEQALLNMAANARDAMPDGGTLTLRLRNAAPEEDLFTTFLATEAKDTVVLDVIDTGHGMDAATQEHLFEPFFTTKERGRGTGLGLASVYGLVKACGGGIDVASMPGRGTTLRLRFPRSLEPAQGGPSGPQRTLAAGTETILLVEDEPTVRETVQRILESRGYHVLAAPDAREARARLTGTSERVHLLLTDVIMPGESGPSLARELVRTHPDLRVLYMSGYTADELGPHGLARPDAPLLRKPFTIEQLSRRIREVLEGPPGQI